jgi:hypothetical protein
MEAPFYTGPILVRLALRPVANASAALVSNNAEAVVLDLVQPTGSGGRLLSWAGQAGLAEVGERRHDARDQKVSRSHRADANKETCDRDQQRDHHEAETWSRSNETGRISRRVQYRQLRFQRCRRGL